MSLLDRVVELKIHLGCNDRYHALCDIKTSIDSTSLWQFAKMFGVLDKNNSAEDFAMEYYTAFNNEVEYTY